MINTILKEWKDVITDDAILNKDLKLSLKKVRDNFNEKIEFKRDGVVAKMGIGTSRINIHTIALMARAYGEFLKKEGVKQVLISNDGRENSDLYTKAISFELSAFKIKTLIFPDNEPSSFSMTSSSLNEMKQTAGIMLTGKDSSLDNSGIRIFDINGDLYDNKQINKINLFLKNKSKLFQGNLALPKHIVPKKIINGYSDARDFKNNLKSKNVVSSVFSMPGSRPAKIFLKRQKALGNKIILATRLNDASKKSVINPDINKSFNKAFRIARKNKSDLFFSIDSELNKFRFAAKYKKRYKYFTNNEVAALFLDYKLSQLKNKKSLSEDDFIIVPFSTGDLVCGIAKKFNIRILKNNFNINTMRDVASANDGSLLFAFDNNNEFYTKEEGEFQFNSISVISEIIKMTSDYKAINLNLYGKLISLWEEYGIKRTFSFAKENISNSNFKSLKKNLLKRKTIGGKLISKIIESQDKGSKNFKLFFSDGSFLFISYNEISKEMEIFVQTNGTKNQRIIDIVSFEKVIESLVDDLTEKFEVKKWSWKGFLKYAFFVSLIIATFSIVFLFVYKSSNTSVGNFSTFTIAGNIFNSHTNALWLIIWVYFVFVRLIDAWKMKRMFMIQGQNVKIKHLFISSLMGLVISFITPFTIGGDAIGYWYLRKQGVKRGSLIAVMMSDTLLYQARFTLQSIILVILGLPLYKEILSSGSPESHAALIWFIVGASWTIFATFMIFLLTLNIRFQEWIVKTSAKLIEWTRFVNVMDPGRLEGTYQYEFIQLRKGMKDIWAKWWFPFEMMFYSLIPLFFNLNTILLMAAGWINFNIHGTNGYVATLVLDDIAGTANSMSITPGGAGTGEWLTVTTRKLLFENHKFTPKSIASGIDLMNKMLFSWPLLLISAISIPTVIILENVKRRSKAKYIINRRRITKRILLIVWVAFAISYLLYFFFVFR